MKRHALLLFCALWIPAMTSATHNRAGEITYSQDANNPLLYRFTVVTYTKTSSQADRPELYVYWGDGTADSIPRVSKVSVGPDISKNTYLWNHLYPGTSTYLIYFEDPNRNGGVVNIPGSVNIPFYIETQLVISPFLGYNNSPVLLQPPIDDGTIGHPFIHNPNAYDPDGDSLSYELIECKGAGGVSIPGYTFPPTQQGGSFSLNAVTGDLVWDSPTIVGEFNVAFLIKEWRNKILIGYVERDMQITIVPSNNKPPSIGALNDICVEAGTVVNFNVSASDPDNEWVTLSATGAPFNFTGSPASFPQGIAGVGTVSGTFNWQTTCDHVRRAAYQVVFTARDSNSQVNLADLESVYITVVAPAPQNLAATPLGNQIDLTWSASVCDSAMGYDIYRRNGFYGFTPGPCETGVPAYTGYAKIGTVNGLNNTAYTDDNNGAGLVHGIDYCYMVVAWFDDGAESYASAEECTQLKKDLPVITNVSVTTTDITGGTMEVAWSKPAELDTIQFPGPFEYRLYRSDDFTGGNFVFVASLPGLDDTTFTHTGTDTETGPNSYRVELHNIANGYIGQSAVASSVFLSVTPTDRRLNLSWNEVVPWANFSYDVFRLNGVMWDSIGTTTIPSFSDSGLVNGQLYCYHIRSVGDYSGSGFVSPIVNLSQESCAMPFDNVPPCPITTFDTLAFDCQAGEVTFEWEHPGPECGSDIGSWHLYYSPGVGAPYYLLAVIASPGQTTYSFTSLDSLAGCYYVTAVDTVGNESDPGNEICFENCPFYELPNVFTPDGNGKNDTWQPFPYRFVQEIDLVVYNRWGQKVFSTNDPDVGWNGRLNNTGGALPEGAYFYICKVYERYRNGIRERLLKPGYVYILRGRGATGE